MSVSEQEAAIFVCAHSECSPKSIKAAIEGTGIASWASFLWNMRHGSQWLHKSWWLKDTIWWTMSRTAQRFKSIFVCEHMIHLGRHTNSPLSWKHVLRCHCPGPRCYLWCNLNEAIVLHKQFDLLRQWCVWTNNKLWNGWKRDQTALKSLTNFLLISSSDNSSAAVPALSPGSTKREQIKIMRSMIWGETKKEIRALWGRCLI